MHNVLMFLTFSVVPFPSGGWPTWERLVENQISVFVHLSTDLLQAISYLAPAVDVIFS